MAYTYTDTICIPYEMDCTYIIYNKILKCNIQFTQIIALSFVQVYKMHRFGIFPIDNTPIRCYNKDTVKDKDSPKNRKGKENDTKRTY